MSEETGIDADLVELNRQELMELVLEYRQMWDRTKKIFCLKENHTKKTVFGKFVITLCKNSMNKEDVLKELKQKKLDKGVEIKEDICKHCKIFEELEQTKTTQFR